jgi:hypothetical protein
LTPISIGVGDAANGGDSKEKTENKKDDKKGKKEEPKKKEPEPEPEDDVVMIDLFG